MEVENSPTQSATDDLMGIIDDTKENLPSGDYIKIMHKIQEMKKNEKKEDLYEFVYLHQEHRQYMKEEEDHGDEDSVSSNEGQCFLAYKMQVTRKVSIVKVVLEGDNMPDIDTVVDDLTDIHGSIAHCGYYCRLDDRLDDPIKRLTIQRSGTCEQGDEPLDPVHYLRNMSCRPTCSQRAIINYPVFIPIALRKFDPKHPAKKIYVAAGPIFNIQ